MEGVQAIVEIISNVGVPVGLLIGCFWLLNKEREDHKAEVDRLRETFDTSLKEIISAINNNTLVMQSIRDRLHSGEEG